MKEALRNFVHALDTARLIVPCLDVFAAARTEHNFGSKRIDDPLAIALVCTLRNFAYVMSHG